MAKATRAPITDRAVLLWIRWLFFLVLSFLVLYTYNDHATVGELWLKAGLLGFYAVSNTLLMWATRAEFKMERWSMPIFVLDTVLVSTSLYFSAGADTELYVMCFRTIYLSTWAGASGTRFRSRSSPPCCTGFFCCTKIRISI